MYVHSCMRITITQLVTSVRGRSLPSSRPQSVTSGSFLRARSPAGIDMPTRLDVPPQQRQARLEHERRASAQRASAITVNERITRSCMLLRRSPMALDVLHTSIGRLRDQPTNEKFRMISLQKGTFAERVAPCQGAMPLLAAIGYEHMHGHLVLQRFDASTVHSALLALEDAKQHPDYQNAKSQASTAAAHQSACAQDEAIKAAQRAAALAKVPKEPSAGDATSSTCQISIHVAGARIARRRFESHDTLEDLSNFVRSLADAPPEPFVLENITTRPPCVLDQPTQGTCSLFSLDLWPVGHVQVAVKA